MQAIRLNSTLGLVAVLISSICLSQGLVVAQENSNDSSSEPICLLLDGTQSISIDECLQHSGAYIEPELSGHAVILEYSKPALVGDSVAQFRIGELYQLKADKDQRSTFPKYNQQALSWFKMAAIKDYVPALLSLALIYEQGEIVPRDIALANDYYARALGIEHPDLSAKIEPTIIDTNALEEQRMSLLLATEKLQGLSSIKSALEKELRGARNHQPPGDYLSLALDSARLQLSKTIQDSESQTPHLEQVRYDAQLLLAQLDQTDGNKQFSASSIKILKNELENDRKNLQAEYDAIEKDKQKQQEIVARIEAAASEASSSEILAMNDESSKGSALQGYLTELENSIQHRSISTDKQKKKIDFLEERIAKLKTTTTRSISSDEKVVLRRALTEIDHRYQGKINYLATNLTDEMARVDSLAEELEVVSKASENKDQHILTIQQQLSKAAGLVDTQSGLVKQQSMDLKTAIEQMNAAHVISAQRPEDAMTAVPSSNNNAAPKIMIKWPQLSSDGSGDIAMVPAGTIVNLIGAVVSDSGIKSFTLNGQSQALDENGFFMTAVEMTATQQVLNLITQDNNGKTTTSNITLKPIESPSNETSLRSGIASAMVEDLNDIDFGNYHALIIGNNEYHGLGMESLDTAVYDATSLAELLEQNYGFEVELVLNADRDKTLQAMEEMRRKLNQDDNLLIYYAGHGIIDPENNQGYWIPVDGASNSTIRWLSNATITDQIRAMNARNVMVIADSCYSGSLMRSGIMSLRSGLTLEKKMKRIHEDIAISTRVALSSGGLQPVADSIDNSPNSVFTGAMLKTLSNNSQLLDADSLATTVGHMVAVATRDSVKQVPRYAPLLKAGHEGGEFYFVPTKWRKL